MSSDFGYFDLQVNGYGGVDFNSDELSAEGFHHACQRMDEQGVAGFLPTIITDHVEAMVRRISRLAELREADELARGLVAGIHIEGPFISTKVGFYGAHPLDAVRTADEDTARRLLDAGRGLVRLVTLAPEQDPSLRVTRLLSNQGVVVSAGHTDASLEQLQAACDAGLTLFTHLGNACPMEVHRHDNIVQRALSLHDRLTPCFIADGVHVPFFALRNYMLTVGIERCIVVTDAMAAAGLGPGLHRLGRWEVQVGEDLAAWAPDRSHLVGSAMSMRQAHRNLRQQLELDEEQCRLLLAINPRKAIGLQ